MSEEIKQLDLFKGYIKTNGKVPLTQYSKAENLESFDAVQKYDSYAGVLGEDIILIDIDDGEQAELLLKIINETDTYCTAIRTTRGIHFYFVNKKPDGSRAVDKAYTKTHYVCGLTGDIKVGCKNSIAIQKKEGVKRKHILPEDFMEDTVDEDAYLPVWLYPVRTDTDLYGMKDGDGRDSTLYAYILKLCELGLTKEEVKNCIRLANKYVLADPLSDADIERICRDGAFPENTFKKGKRFDAIAFGDWLIAEYRMKNIEGERCMFLDGEYVSADEHLEHVIWQNMKLEQKANNEVVNYIKRALGKRGEGADPKYIAFSNGILDIETGSMMENVGQLNIRNLIRHDYLPDCYCEFTDRILDKLSCGDHDVRLLLEEAIGYGMFRRNELGKSFMLVGEKSNGKSTFLEAVKTLYGKNNVSGLDIQQLGDRFSTIDIVGKLANIGDDIPDGYIDSKTTSFFKKIVTGNGVRVEDKGVKGYTYDPYCKLFFSANEIPRMKDRTGAVLRRMIIIPFNATFSKDDADYDPFIITKIKSEASLQYLARVGVEGLKRVLARQDFTEPAVVSEALKEYQMEVDSVLSFITDVMGEDEMEMKSTADVFKAYEVFCTDNRIEPMKKGNFCKQICRRGKLEVYVTRVNGKQQKLFRKAKM